MGNRQTVDENPPDLRLKKGLQEIKKDLEYKHGFSQALCRMSEEDLEALETPEEKFKGAIKLCRLTNIYDGDTATIVFYNGEKLECFKFRVYGYDSPEMRLPKSWSLDKRAQKKRDAVCAKVAFANFTEGKKLVVDIMGKDKYGRLLGKLYAFPRKSGSCHDISDVLGDMKKYDVAHYMITNNHGYSYTGGKKRTSK